MKFFSKRNTLKFIILTFVSFTSCKKEVSNPPPPDPVACFNLSKNFQKPDESIAFTNCAENFETLFWDFGDGNTSNENNPSHSWKNVGDYTVTLNVSKNNKTVNFTKKIVIANQVQIDFNVLMKNFKGAVTSNSFSCQCSAINSQNKQTIFFDFNYPAINHPSYTINTDISGLYIVKETGLLHRFKLLAKNNQGNIDSLITDEIDIVESANYINKTAKLNFCDVDYTINLRYQ